VFEVFVGTNNDRCSRVGGFAAIRCCLRCGRGQL